MPELPDVEHFRRYVAATALHKRVRSVDVRTTKVLGRLSKATLRDRVAGNRLEAADRYAKYLFLRLQAGGWMVWHFGMSGEPAYDKDEGDPHRHDRIILHLANGYRLAYRSQRMIGEVGLTEDKQAFIEDRELGPDAMAVPEEQFVELARQAKGSVKSAFLMNQNRIAGIGNVYSDEILFQARIHPQGRADRLDAKTLRRLYRTMRRVLQSATDRRADPDAFPRAWLTRRRDEGAECPRGCGQLSTAQVGGRTTYFCTKCQRKEG